MIKIDSHPLASELAARFVFKIREKSNQDFINKILANEKLIEDLVNIFEQALKQCANRITQEEIGKPHKENAKCT